MFKLLFINIRTYFLRFWFSKKQQPPGWCRWQESGDKDHRESRGDLRKGAGVSGSVSRQEWERPPRRIYQHKSFAAPWLCVINNLMDDTNYFQSRRMPF